MLSALLLYLMPKQARLLIAVCVAAWLGHLLPHSGDGFGPAPHPGCVPSAVVQVNLSFSYCIIKICLNGLLCLDALLLIVFFVHLFR